MVKSPPPSHFGINKYCVTRAGRGARWSAAAGSGVCAPGHPAPHPPGRGRGVCAAGLGRPRPSLRAQDDVDARIREHGPAHLPCPQCKGGVFKRLLHLTWGRKHEGWQVGGGGQDPGCRPGPGREGRWGSRLHPRALIWTHLSRALGPGHSGEWGPAEGSRAIREARGRLRTASEG